MILLLVCQEQHDAWWIMNCYVRYKHNFHSIAGF